MTESGAFSRLFNFFAIKEKWYSDYATVISVDENKCTCEVDIKDGVSGLKARRVASLNRSNAFVVKPTIGSRVLVTYTSKTSCFISMYSEIDSIMMISDDHGGLVDVKSLLKKINALENKVMTHQHTYVLLGSPAITTPDLTTNPVFSITTESEISNSKITH